MLRINFYEACVKHTVILRLAEWVQRKWHQTNETLVGDKNMVMTILLYAETFSCIVHIVGC